MQRPQEGARGGLGISPQTMTDICKGRSAVTLKHLSGIVKFFGLRASYWLDESRSEPAPFDRFDVVPETTLRELEALGLHDSEGWVATLRNMQRFVALHREDYEREFGPLRESDALLLGGELRIETAPERNGKQERGLQSKQERGRAARLTTSRSHPRG
jgi:hypothetical protein